ncbi:SprT family zinc-dependent metalloprotease [Tissierella sp. Yu-01]|uniref:M48 family metallopeptidase n=1 Tax=Tissierella sp. Yu-01 TaxID=3035694 RepID=UPI00240D940E|nr:SprT family zinc-dependent metalloprotease [Tissierella sp. Yu-01]WFA08970.1 SprT family zinc-dependent metalloprotease [Tissierella sp. Yu-01]
MKVDFGDFTIDCEVQYGKRKKLLISIDSVGYVTVKAPNNTSEEVITNVIKKYKKEIKSRLDLIEKESDKSDYRLYENEGKFLYLGKEVPLSELIDIDGLNEEGLKEKLKKFYFSSCKSIVNERVKFYQRQIGIKPKVIEVNDSKTKWGECTSDKIITFNYRLIMAPIEIIDYVVVHEMCHLHHMNHDRSFGGK